MTIRPIRSLGLTGALVLMAAANVLAGPAAAQASGGGCPAAVSDPQPRKKGFGLGKLMSGARNRGLFGSVMGAMRGDGNLGADLSGAARNAATDAAERAAECLGQPASGAGDSTAPTVEQPRAMRQASVRPQRERLSYPSEIAKPDNFAAVRDAFTEFGKDECMECEGGYAYDSWVSFPRDDYSSKYNGDAQRIGSWPVGHVHHWKGNVSTGTLTVVAEEMVEGFRCRRLAYRLTKGNAAAERPGLLCWGRANPFAGKESWNEVY